jgi:hypothetical protein
VVPRTPYRGHRPAKTDRRAIEPSLLKFEVTPVSQKLKWCGTLFATCYFRGNGEMTFITTELTSNKNPGIFLKGLIKLVARILRYQSRKHESQAIEAIEERL